MLFYAGCIIEEPAIANPALVALTDRNDLGDQLFGQFRRCHEILRQTPVQAGSVEHLRKLLNVASGGVVLTPARPRLVGLRPARFARSMSVGPPFLHSPPSRSSCRRKKSGGSGVIEAPQYHRDRR
jgi:hypothetical protein